MTKNLSNEVVIEAFLKIQGLYDQDQDIKKALYLGGLFNLFLQLINPYWEALIQRVQDFGLVDQRSFQ